MNSQELNKLAATYRMLNEKIQESLLECGAAHSQKDANELGKRAAVLVVKLHEEKLSLEQALFILTSALETILPVWQSEIQKLILMQSQANASKN